MAKLSKLHQQFLSNLVDCRKTAKDFFGDKATEEHAFRIFDLLPAKSDGDADYEEGKKALETSANIAREIFGDNASPDSVLEVFERCFTDEGDDE
jgi:hypothetical protein